MGLGNDEGGSSTRECLCSRVRLPYPQPTFELPADDLNRNARQKQFNILKPFLPRYFSSEWSHSQFRLPAPALPPSRLPFSHSSTSPEGPGGRSTPTVEDDVCRCAWIDYEVSTTKSTKGKERLVPPESRVEAQIIALTNSGGWYRISLGPGDRSSGDSFGLGKDSTSDCRLEEYRRFGGDKDGW